MFVAAAIALVAGISIGWWLRGARHGGYSRVLDELYARKIRLVEADLDLATRALDASKANAAALANRISELEHALSIARETQAAVTAARARLEDAADARTREIQALRQALDEARAASDALRLAHGEAIADRERAELSLEEACAELAARKADAAASCEREQAALAERDRLRSDVAEREARLAAAMDEAVVLARRAAELERRIAEAREREQEREAAASGRARNGHRDLAQPAPRRAAVGAAPAATSAERDDLTRIAGIGPALAKKLRRAGVTSYRQLAEMSRADLERTAAKLGVSVERIRRERWVDTARGVLRARSAV